MHYSRNRLFETRPNGIFYVGGKKRALDIIRKGVAMKYPDCYIQIDLKKRKMDVGPTGVSKDRDSLNKLTEVAHQDHEKKIR